MTTTAALAAVLEHVEQGGFTIREIQLDSPLDREILVRVKASSLCHSDLNFAVHDYGNPFPAVLGHEFSGIVESVGSKDSELAPGDHVVAFCIPACGQCTRCLEGNRIKCLNRGVAARDAQLAPRITVEGKPTWQLSGLGGFASHALVHETQLVKVDPSLPFDQAAVLGCAVVTGAGAVMRSANVQPRDSIVVIGAGGVGLNAVQAGVLVGASKIIVVDLQDDKLELAKQFGATHTINGKQEDVVESIRSLTDGAGVEHVFEMTGFPGPLQQGFTIAGMGGGKLYIVGMQKPGSFFEMPTDVGHNPLLRYGPSIQVVNMGSTNFKVDIPYFSKLALQGRFDLAGLVSDHITIREINAGYAAMKLGGGVGRTVIIFD